VFVREHYSSSKSSAYFLDAFSSAYTDKEVSKKDATQTIVFEGTIKTEEYEDLLIQLIFLFEEN
jgi:hypothetical protein